jgi:hypothetical protein
VDLRKNMTLVPSIIGGLCYIPTYRIRIGELRGKIEKANGKKKEDEENEQKEEKEGESRFSS